VRRCGRLAREGRVLAVSIRENTRRCNFGAYVLALGSHFESASMCSGPSFEGVPYSHTPRPLLRDMDAAPKCVYTVPQRPVVPRFLRAMRRRVATRCARASIVIVARARRNRHNPWLFLARLASALALWRARKYGPPCAGAAVRELRLIVASTRDCDPSATSAL
jgi:hypothetical protein